MAVVTRISLDVAVATLRAEGLDVTEWTDAPGTRYETHAHGQTEVRVVLDGSMTITTGGKRHRLRRGDRIDLGSGEDHSAEVHADGVRYLAGSARPSTS